MADPDQAFEDLKKEIRGVLMPLKEGCTLFELRKDFKTFIGRPIPAAQFGYHDDISLLQDIPDVVQMYERRGEYILSAVADDSTSHIQKLVAKQKQPAKKKTSRCVPKYSQSSRYQQRTYNAPPTRNSYSANNNYRPSASRQTPAATKSFNWTYNGTSNQPLLPTPATSAVHNTQTSVSNNQNSATRPSLMDTYANSRPLSTGVNPSQNYVHNKSSVVNNNAPVVSRPSAVSNQPLASRQSFAGNNPSPFVSNSSPARATNVVSNSSTAQAMPVVSNQSAVSNQPPASRQSFAGNTPSPFVSNSTPVRATNVVSNQSAIRNQPPASRQSLAGNNPSPFVSNSSSAQAMPVVSNQSSASNSSVSASYNFSKQFQSDLPPRFRAGNRSSSTTLLPPEVECKIVDVVRKYSTGLLMKDFFTAYQRNFSEKFSLEKHGFCNLKECLETIPDLTMRPSMNNNDFIIKYNPKATQMDIVKMQENNLSSGATGYSLQSFETCDGPTTSFKSDKTRPIFKFTGAWANTRSGGIQAQSQSRQNQNSRSPNLEPVVSQASACDEERKVSKPRADALDSFELNDLKVSRLGLTEQMKNKFELIISKNKQGIRAQDFPAAYEKVTGSQFDLHTLGYTHLSDLVDSLPDIFHRKSIAGSRKDWLIIPAKDDQDPENIPTEGDPVKKEKLQINCCAENTRMILEGYPEGIPISDFLHIYSINCNEPLYVGDLGYDSIELFLEGIANDVPLKIELEKGVETIFLDKVKAEAISQLEAAMAAHEPVLPESIPFDAASPDCEYKKLILPMDIGTSNYIPVYTSDLVSPGEFFIQLEGEDTSLVLNKLSDELEQFYNGSNSAYYTVQERHIKEGAMCACQWPKDKLWYRARITTVVSPELAKVFYVDYGTSDVVPVELLRYLKESFSKLPAQAIKASLAHLKPPNKNSGWSKEAKKRMLSLCRDNLLMAQVAEKKDGVLHLILCDTSDKHGKDLYINDTLMEEGLAVSTAFLEDPETAPPQPVQVPILDAQHHIIEAECFYKALNSLLYKLPADQVVKTMADMALSYPNNPYLQKDILGMSSPGANPYQSLLDQSSAQLLPGSTAYQPPAFGAVTNQLPAGTVAAGQPMLANQLFPGSSTFQSPRMGVGQLPTESMANSAKSMLGSMTNHQLSGSPMYQPSTGQTILGGTPSSSATASSVPPGFSAHQRSAGIGYGQSPPGIMTNQFPPGFGSGQPSSKVDAEAAGCDLQTARQSKGSTNDESEFFEDDDDDFEEFLEKSSSVTKRYVKRIRTDDGYFFHILIVDEQPYVSSGEISSIIWWMKEPDYLLKMLQNKDTVFESQSISEEGNELMFDQFEKFHVKGIQKDDETACLVIYPLHSTMQIINEYGHPSVELRQQIRNEMESFNPNLPAWQELAEMEIPETEETFPVLTDEEKFDRLCLYDLKHIKEGIRVKIDSLNKKLAKEQSPIQAKELSGEILKNKNLNQRVVLRMDYIERVCSSFS